jgi:hypothetical protein
MLRENLGQAVPPADTPPDRRPTKNRYTFEHAHALKGILFGVLAT